MKFPGAKAIAEAADENAKSALAPTATKPEAQSPAEVCDTGATGGGSAVRVLALAQKLHDEYVAEGQNTRKRLISEGQLHRDALIAEAQQKMAEVLQGLSNERSLMKKEIEELRTFGLDLRTHLKSYLQDQLSELEQTGADQHGLIARTGNRVGTGSSEGDETRQGPAMGRADPAS